MPKKHDEGFNWEDINMADSKICSRINAGSLLLAGLMLATVVSPVTIVSAEELNADTVAVPLSEPQLAGKVAVYHDEETYGLSKLAGLAERSRPAIADERLAEEVSFIVAGGISNPGEYSLRSPVDILDAVLAAGGPSADGSMRRVEIYQTGTLLGEYDLYSFLSEGRIADDFIFNGGEQVVVLSCGPRVSVSGSVRAPAVFELKDGEMTLGRVLELAGGFSYGLGIYHVEVVRVADSRQQVVFSADIDAGADVPVFSLEPGDRIGVLRSDKLRLDDVYVQLPGNLCGNFGYRPDMRVSDLLGCLQPLPENIALNYAEILREGRSDKKYDVIGISIDVLLRQVALGDRSNDLILCPGDRLVFFDREFLDKRPVVGVEVPGQPLILVDYKPGMTASDLLEGVDVGFSDKKLRSAIYRRQLNGSKLDVVKLILDIDAVRRESRRQDIELQPFDTLLIEY